MCSVLFARESTSDAVAKGQRTVLAAEATEHWPVAESNVGQDSVGQESVDPSWSSHVTAEACGCRGFGDSKVNELVLWKRLDLTNYSL